MVKEDANGRKRMLKLTFKYLNNVEDELVCYRYSTQGENRQFVMNNAEICWFTFSNLTTKFSLALSSASAHLDQSLCSSFGLALPVMK